MSISNAVIFIIMDDHNIIIMDIELLLGHIQDWDAMQDRLSLACEVYRMVCDARARCDREEGYRCVELNI